MMMLEDPLIYIANELKDTIKDAEKFIENNQGLKIIKGQ